MSVKKSVLQIFSLLLIVGVLLIMQFVGFSGITGFIVFNQQSEDDFTNGTYVNTEYNGSSIILSGANVSGNYTSQIFDAGSAALWNNISWARGGKYQQELPDSQGSESGLGGIDMSGNVLLMHMNEISGTIGDSSGNANDGTQNGGVAYGAAGKFSTALGFDGVDDYVTRAYDSDFDFGTGGFSVGGWFKHDSIASPSSGGVSVRVSADDDDAEECLPAGGRMSLDSSDLEFVVDTSACFEGDGSGVQEVGMRFNGLTLPKGAIITNAYIQFTVDETGSGSTNLTFFGESSDNATIFTTTDGDITNRTKTVSNVGWTVPAWSSVGDAGADQRTPDLSPIIQEVVDRSGWASGNSLVIISNGTGTRTAESHDGSSANAPLLVVDYTTGGDNYLASRYDNDQGFKIWMNSSGNVLFGIDDDSTWNPDDVAASGGGYDNDQWHHLTAVKDGTTGIYLYVDGVQVGSDTSLVGTGTLSSDSASLSIGADEPGKARFWNGTIDEFAIWNKTLSANEILDMYKRGALRLNLTVRSCDDGACSGENFLDVDDISPQDLSVNNNTYFQYRFNFETDNESYSPELFNVTIDYTLLATAPIVDIVAPQEDTSLGYNESIELNFTVSSDDLGSCWYTLDSGVMNNTIASCANTTFDVSGNGSYTLVLYANETVSGLEGSDNVNFSVSLGAPSIVLTSPIDAYLNYTENIQFVYTATDVDLDSCQLWGNFSGGFSLNQTDSGVVSGEESYFYLNLSDKTYSWNIYCNDTSGNSAFNGNQTFYVDTVVPIIDLTEPTGTYSSTTDIPLTFIATDSSPLYCQYNVTFESTGSVVIGNTEVVGCTSTTFNVDIDSNYVLDLLVNDSAGNHNFSNSSFVVDSPEGGSTGGSSGGGGGGGSSGGGGGGARRR
ncbi:MAG: LamG domain-containing protein, partial [Bacteroidetes bacterium]|nr:LamG domain-containing protein [Bacteroidota bacterium]